MMVNGRFGFVDLKLTNILVTRGNEPPGRPASSASLFIIKIELLAFVP
jgi:hypothetical protein